MAMAGHLKVGRRRCRFGHPAPASCLTPSFLGFNEIAVPEAVDSDASGTV